MSVTDERVMQFEPGDRVQVNQGQNKGAIAEVVGLNGEGKVVVRSIEKKTERAFKPSWLTRLDFGEQDSPETGNTIPQHTETAREQDSPESESESLARLVDEEWEQDSPKSLPSTVEHGNTVPHPEEQPREYSSPEFKDHPFPVNGNSVPHMKPHGLPRRGNPGNTVPRPPEIDRLEHLIRWQSELSQKDTLRDRWLYEEVSETRTRYRLRWRKDGRLHSQELSQEEFEAMREQIHHGQMLTHIDALIKLLLVELVPGHDDTARERRAAIEQMLETGQPFSTVAAAIAGMSGK